MEENNNPLLGADRLPRFSEIRPEHVQPAIDAVLESNRRRIAASEAERENATWDAFVRPLEEIEDRLARTWSPVSHLNAVKDSDALRAEYEACLPKLAAYATELGQNEKIYAGFRHIREGPGYASLDRAQRTTVDHALRDFRLSGVALPDAEKRRFKKIQERLSSLGNVFERNLLDATQGWYLDISDVDDLSGLPSTALDMARQLARNDGREGWRFTLDVPSYLAFMTYADSRALREKLYAAYVTRASEEGPGAGRYDNSSVMTEIIELRREKSRLLGFANYAEYSMATKMAESPAQTIEFLKDLARRARPVAEREVAQLRTFAARESGLADLAAWDVPYYSEKLKQSLYDFSEEDIRPYFPVDAVMRGLFDVVGRLYGLKIERIAGVDAWDPAVEFYQIRDAAGLVRGQFYVDLYMRPHKRGGAWMDAFVNRKRNGDEVQVPVACLTCNFSIPTEDKPSLLTHDEVITLFHEFGHGLHHMLTRVDNISVSGINGVAWDAVELPSQFLENWCWQSEALDLIGGHYESGEPLPAALLEKLKRARNFQSGMQMLRQVEFALFDMRLHSDYQGGDRAAVQALLEEVRSEVAVIEPPPYNRFQNGFSHIFAGGYAAGYYSYKWAEVLSADAFSLFEERGIFDADTGQSFLANILETGGAVDPLEAFVAFRGRKPTADALMRHSGLSPAGALGEQAAT
jgi:oligopeptidase A